jgi:ABC-type multidrug transport system fused ATPase/permease subunit
VSLLWAGVALIAANALTITAMLLVRRRAPEGSYFTDGDRASGVFGVLAGGFAIFAGFIIFLVFATYDQSRAGGEAEALTVIQQFETAEFLQYKLAASAEADDLKARATAASERVGTFIQRADNYSLAVVLFAASLFFVGISTRLDSSMPKVAVLGLGYTLFLGTVIWIARFPVSVSG